MKTSTFKYFGLALMAILMVSFTSCEVEIDSFYDDDNGAGYYNRSADLCSRTWVSFYRDMDGNYCRQELDFFLDHTGIDRIRVEYPNGVVNHYEYNFRWSWENYAQTSIHICMYLHAMAFQSRLALFPASALVSDWRVSCVWWGQGWAGKMAQ